MSNKIAIMQGNNKIECDLLFTINDERKGVKYIVCTDNTKDENGNAKVYLARYEGKKIISVSDKEKKMLEDVVNMFQYEVLNYES